MKKKKIHQTNVITQENFYKKKNIPSISNSIHYTDTDPNAGIHK